MAKIAKFFALPAEQKKLILHAAILLPIADMALHMFGYRKTQQALARNSKEQKIQISPDAGQFAQAQVVANCVRLAARNGPYRTTCLRESLVTWWLLQSRGMPVLLKIGIAKDKENFNAHAWVELGDTPIIDPDDTQLNFSSIYGSDMIRAGVVAFNERDIRSL